MFVDCLSGSIRNDGAYVRNGDYHGGFQDQVDGMRFEYGLLRPYIDTNPNSRTRGRPVVTINIGTRDDGSPKQAKVLIRNLQNRGINTSVWNAVSMRKEDWIRLDTNVIRANRLRLKAWADLMAANPLGGFDGMSKMTIEYEAMTDPGEAQVDMDAISDGRTDSPLFKLRSMPLPIIHSDFWYSQRRIAISRNSNTPLDTVSGEAAGRRCAELIEKMTIGIEAGPTFGGVTTGPTATDGTSAVYGYTNFPYRVTKTNLTIPTGSNPYTVVNDVISMMETMYSNGYFGPFILYTSTGYSQYLAGDYFANGGTLTAKSVRQRLLELEGLTDIRRLDYLTSGYQLILVQMDPNVAQAVNGMDITTVQWESQGGLRRNFKVMAIQVPLLRAPFNGVAGIIHGTTS